MKKETKSKKVIVKSEEGDKKYEVIVKKESEKFGLLGFRDLIRIKNRPFNSYLLNGHVFL